jgi:hypothetical protein
MTGDLRPAALQNSSPSERQGPQPTRTLSASGPGHCERGSRVSASIVIFTSSNERRRHDQDDAARRGTSDGQVARQRPLPVLVLRLRVGRTRGLDIRTDVGRSAQATGSRPRFLRSSGGLDGIRRAPPAARPTRALADGQRSRVRRRPHRLPDAAPSRARRRALLRPANDLRDRPGAEPRSPGPHQPRLPDRTRPVRHPTRPRPDRRPGHGVDGRASHRVAGTQPRHRRRGGSPYGRDPRHPRRLGGRPRGRRAHPDAHVHRHRDRGLLLRGRRHRHSPAVRRPARLPAGRGPWRCPTVG